MKKEIILLLLTVMLALTGCGKSEITCDADEIMLYSWAGDGAELLFHDNKASLLIESGELSTLIEGVCVFDDSQMVIADSSGSFSFGYTLGGKTLTLGYDGASLTLIRES